MKNKCIHFHICINSPTPLCSDSKCSLIKQEKVKEDQIRLEEVRQALDTYKVSLGLNIDDSFNKLNIIK